MSTLPFFLLPSDGNESMETRIKVQFASVCVPGSMNNAERTASVLPAFMATEKR